MIVSRVRRIRKCGIGKNKRLRMANVVLENDWLGKKVVVIEYNMFLMLKKQIRGYKLILKQVKRICNK